MNLRPILISLGLAKAPQSGCGCPEGMPGEDPAFSAAVTALGAKLARADGHAAAVEYDSFVEAFPPEPKAEGDVRRLYRLARETTLGFEGYARRLGKRYGRCPELLEKVIDGLFHVAKADGAVTGDELAYLERVAHLFGLSPMIFGRLKRSHMGAPADDPYGVLNVEPDAPDEAVRAAWRKALFEHHPDRALGRGLSADLVEAAQRQAQAINAAFEAVMRERHSPAASAA